MAWRAPAWDPENDEKQDGDDRDRWRLDQWLHRSRDLQRIVAGDAAGGSAIRSCISHGGRAAIAGIIGLGLLLLFQERRPDRGDIAPLIVVALGILKYLRCINQKKNGPVMCGSLCAGQKQGTCPGSIIMRLGSISFRPVNRPEVRSPRWLKMRRGNRIEAALADQHGGQERRNLHSIRPINERAATTEATR